MVEPLLPAGPSPNAPISSRRALLTFGAFAIALLLVEGFAAQSRQLFAAPHDLGALAITFDLAVFAPLVYWWMVVRRAKVSPFTIIPVVSLGLAAAMALLPAEQRGIAQLGRYAMAPAEIGFIWWAVVRARRALRAPKPHGAHDAGDFVAHLRVALREIVRIRAVADAVAFEVALLYYAFFTWRSAPHVPAGARPFTTHQKSGDIGLLGAAGFITVIETGVVHILVQRHSQTVAWVLTALSIYGLVWILGFIQAIRLRPILVTPHSVVVRIGLLTAVEIPYTAIARLTPASFPYPEKGTPGYLRAFIAGDPRFLLELREPLQAEGAYGMKKQVSVVGLALDDPAEFRAAVEDHLAARPTA